ncbi:MAG: geranylgeranyl reductase family protein [Candidatus Micrarchaeia archaeon]
MKYDIHIIGGGVSGSVAAYQLAKSGLSVIVSEEDARIGFPSHCTGVVSTRGLIESGFDYRKAILNRFYGARIIAPDGEEIIVKRKDVQAYLVDRSLLDIIYSENAENAGAIIKTGVRISSKKQYMAEVIIGADGANSTIAEIEGFPKIRKFARGYQEIISHKDIVNDNMVNVYLSQKLFPGFFGWVVPVCDGKAIIGFGASKNIPIGGIMKKFMEWAEIRENYKTEHKFGGMIPLGIRARLQKSNVLLVGDAGGFAKATSGGGVYYSTLSAKMAAKCIADNCISDYERMIAKTIKELKLHMYLREVYNLLDDFTINSIVRFIRFTKLYKYIEEKGDMDYVSSLFK